MSCDDSGQLHNLIQKGLVTMRFSNLQNLEVTTLGHYEAWLKLDSSGNIEYYSLGQFNIEQGSGKIVDLSGNNMIFTYSGDTNRLYLAKSVIVSLETSTVSQPTTPLLSGTTAITEDSIYANLLMSGSEALGTTGSNLINQQPYGHTPYIVDAPTFPADCKKGIWFCDSTHVLPVFPVSLPASSPWVFEGWIRDTTTNQYWSTGRFRDSSTADSDGPGSCAGSGGSPYQMPGQDWIQTGGNCPNITSLTAGNYEVFITLEPAYRPSNTNGPPFYLRLFYNGIVSSTACNRVSWMGSLPATFPKGNVKITY